jgi:hypothetical protein
VFTHANTMYIMYAMRYNPSYQICNKYDCGKRSVKQPADLSSGVRAYE